MAPFFRYVPADDGSLTARYAALGGRGSAARRLRVAEALALYQERIGADPPAVENAARLGRGAVAVVTGQQPGLLGGPLFTAYKAVTAIMLARRAEGLLGVPVVPVFWVASDDHDFSEVNAAWAVDRRGRLQELRLPGVQGAIPGGAYPVGARALQLAGTLAEVAGAGPHGQYPHTAEVTAFALAAGRRSASLAEWFARLMARLFSRHGLVLLDPRLAELRAEAGEVLAEAVARREEVAGALRAAGEALGARGFPAAFARGDQAYLFMEEGQRRTGLVWDGRSFADRRGSFWAAERELESAIRSHPEKFSPSAALRPVVQEVLLPTLCQVAGPGELTYLAQLKEVFSLFGLEMPPVRPRLSLTMVPPEVAVALERFGISYGEVAAGLGERLRAELASLDDVGLEAVFAAHRGAIAAAYGELARRLSPFGEGMAALVAGNRDRVLRQAAYLEAKAWQHHRRRNREVVAAFRAMESWLRPGGAMQEQRLGWLALAFRLGWGLADVLLEAPLTPEHHLAYWEG